MAELDKNIILDMVNMAGKYKFGEDIVIDGKLNFSILGDIASKFINNNEVNVEIRQNDELAKDESNIEFEEDKIIINNNPLSYTVTVVKYITDEFDIISNSISNINTGLHNDRIADIMSGEVKYRQACETIDDNFRLETLKDAETLLTKGMNKLEKEIENSVNRVNSIPRNFIEKLYKPKMKLSEVDEEIKNTRESLEYYTRAIAFVSMIGCELGEINRLYVILNKSKEFLQNTFTMEKRERLNGFDIKNDNFMIEKIDEVLDYIDNVKESTANKKQVYLLKV